jgi:hypothetical protein
MEKVVAQQSGRGRRMVIAAAAMALVAALSAPSASLAAGPGRWACKFVPRYGKVCEWVVDSAAWDAGRSAAGAVWSSYQRPANPCYQLTNVRTSGQRYVNGQYC